MSKRKPPISQIYALGAHVKWLRQAAEEIRAAGHAGWGNTCAQAADAIEKVLKGDTVVLTAEEFKALMKRIPKRRKRRRVSEIA